MQRSLPQLMVGAEFGNSTGVQGALGAISDCPPSNARQSVGDLRVLGWRGHALHFGGRHLDRNVAFDRYGFTCIRRHPGAGHRGKIGGGLKNQVQHV